MNSVLVTGAPGFLGFHVIKLLNERGLRPRALVSPSDDLAVSGLQKLNVDIFEGEISDSALLAKACEGVDTVFHLKFGIKVGGGEETEQHLHKVNVLGTRNLLDAASAAGVQTIVISSSALAVGLNREPKPLDENADWEIYHFDLLYAISRRHAEQEALAYAEKQQSPRIVVINPSFTLGPDDYVGAPANKLVKTLSKGRFPFNPPIGFGCLDVRDYADGALRAAEKGRHATRYILNGHNIKSDQLIKAVAEAAGVNPPRVLIPVPVWGLRPIVKALGLWGKVTSQPPKVTEKILQLWNRYAWYNSGRALEELGWKPRPLDESLKASLTWLQANETKT